MSNVSFEVCDLSKIYGQSIAVDAVSFSFDRPGIVGLLGPNGSGKSTTIKMSVGALLPTTGEVRICGYNLSHETEEAKRHLGYLQDTPILYKEMRVDHYLEMVAALKRVPKAKIRSQIDWVVDACSLEAVLRKRIGTCSRGYRQRIGMAQSILGEPDVIFMDEPTATLDPIQVSEINNMLCKLAERHLIFFSTHILSEAEKVCREIMVIQAGRIRAHLQKTSDGWAGSEKLLEVMIKCEDFDSVSRLVVLSLPGVASIKKTPDGLGCLMETGDMKATRSALWQVVASGTIAVTDVRTSTNSLEQMVIDIFHQG